jgi:hypothetical protein
MPFEENYDAHTKLVLERLMELGRDGWEVASVDLTWHPSYSPAAQAHTPVPVLLQREVA